MINESRGKYQTRESRIRTRTIIDPFETRADLSPGRPKVEGRRPIRSTGELDLKDAFISLPFEQNLPRGLMLRLLSFNGLLIVQHPGRRRVERCSLSPDADSRRNRKNEGRIFFENVEFRENFSPPPFS